MRKLSLVVAGIALTATVSACLGGPPPPPPPPPPPDPHDVLVVGDSISFALGCVLGDGVVQTSPPTNCQPRQGYTTTNNWEGACTISQGTLLMYNRWTISTPNCYNWQTTWSDWADHFTPKVVVINTGGWEIVDRWSPDAGFPDGCPPDNAFGCPPPDYQWGGPTSGSAYAKAKAWYTYQLKSAIDMFLSKPSVQKVLVANSPYSAGPNSVPDTSPDPCPNNPIACHAFWEPYPSSSPMNGQPNQQSDNQPGPTNYTENWQSPNAFTGYRSSKAKIGQFNASIQWLKDNFYAGDNRMSIFNFFQHFDPPDPNPPNQPGFKEHVCPPPNDATVTPTYMPDLHDGVPFGTMAWQCQLGIAPNPNGDPYAVLAHSPGEDAHLTSAGMFQILQPYLEPVVCQLLGKGAPDANAPKGCT